MLKRYAELSKYHQGRSTLNLYGSGDFEADTDVYCFISCSTYNSLIHILFLSSRHSHHPSYQRFPPKSECCMYNPDLHPKQVQSTSLNLETVLTILDGKNNPCYMYLNRVVMSDYVGIICCPHTCGSTRNSSTDCCTNRLSRTCIRSRPD
jgi:hypothetical protein